MSFSTRHGSDLAGTMAALTVVLQDGQNVLAERGRQLVARGRSGGDQRCRGEESHQQSQKENAPYQCTKADSSQPKAARNDKSEGKGLSAGVSSCPSESALTPAAFRPDLP